MLGYVGFGAVAADRQKDLAQQIAANVGGVRDVHNRLTVDATEAE